MEETKVEVLKKHVHEIDTLAVRIGAIAVVDKVSYDEATDIMGEIKTRKEVIVDFFKPLKEKTWAAHKALTAQENASLDRFVNMTKYITKELRSYKAEQDRLDAIERKKREEAERKAAQKEQDRLLKLADKAEKKNDVDLADKFVEDADDVVTKPALTVNTVKKTEKTESGTAITWVDHIEIEVKDEKAICNMITNGDLPVSCVKVIESEIKKHVKSFGIKSGDYGAYRVNRTKKERIRNA
jgi:hypothetical protein